MNSLLLSSDRPDTMTPKEHGGSGMVPLPNGSNGRDSRGRFGAGNKAAVGHVAPHAHKVAALRAALLDAVTPDDIRDIAKTLIARAKEGDRHAVRELFDRVLGAPDKETWTADNVAEAIHAALNRERALKDPDLDPVQTVLRAFNS